MNSPSTLVPNTAQGSLTGSLSGEMPSCLRSSEVVFECFIKLEGNLRLLWVYRFRRLEAQT